MPRFAAPEKLNRVLLNILGNEEAPITFNFLCAADLWDPKNMSY